MICASGCWSKARVRDCSSPATLATAVSSACSRAVACSAMADSTTGGWRSCSTCTAGRQVEVHPVLDRLGSLSARIAFPFEGRTDEPRAYAYASQKSSAAVDLIIQSDWVPCLVALDRMGGRVSVLPCWSAALREVPRVSSRELGRGPHHRSRRGVRVSMVQAHG
jgi:hypothetical protein